MFTVETENLHKVAKMMSLFRKGVPEDCTSALEQDKLYNYRKAGVSVKASEVSEHLHNISDKVISVDETKNFYRVKCNGNLLPKPCPLTENCKSNKKGVLISKDEVMARAQETEQFNPLNLYKVVSPIEDINAFFDLESRLATNLTASTLLFLSHQNLAAFTPLLVGAIDAINTLTHQKKSQRNNIKEVIQKNLPLTSALNEADQRCPIQRQINEYTQKKLRNQNVKLEVHSLDSYVISLSSETLEEDNTQRVSCNGSLRIGNLAILGCFYANDCKLHTEGQIITRNIH